MKKIFLAHQKISALDEKDLKSVNQFLLGLNSINYQFWDLKENDFVRYQNKGKVETLCSFEEFVSLFSYMETKNFDTKLITENILIEHFGDIPDKSTELIY